MKIIVPTDFSELSWIAVKYAAQFASSTGNPLVLLSNVSLEAMPRAAVLVNLNEKMESAAMEDLRDLSGRIKKELDPAPDLFLEITRESDTAEAIVNAAVSHDAALIVMGSRGASGLAGAFLGSVSSGVIRKSKIPVLVIPSEAQFRKGGVAVMAINPEAIPSERTLEMFSGYCEKSGFPPEFLVAGYTGSEPAVTNLKNKLQSILQNAHVVIHSRPEKEPETAIQSLMESHPVSLLAVDPGQHSFFERITGKSVTTRVIASATVPVLALG